MRRVASRRWVRLSAAVVALGLVALSCDTKKGVKPKTGGAGSVTKAKAVELCLKCGQIKGTAECCKPGATKCASCGLAKGSPGCCNIPAGATSAALCAKCGQIKGSDVCCKPGQLTCSKCGLVKGSPGCCKIPKGSS